MVAGGTSKKTGILPDIMMCRNHDRFLFEQKSLMLLATKCKKEGFKTAWGCRVAGRCGFLLEIAPNLIKKYCMYLVQFSLCGSFQYLSCSPLHIGIVWHCVQFDSSYIYIDYFFRWLAQPIGARCPTHI